MMAAFLPPQIRAFKDYLKSGVFPGSGKGPRRVPDFADFFARCAHLRTVSVPNLSFPARLRASELAVRRGIFLRFRYFMFAE